MRERFYKLGSLACQSLELASFFSWCAVFYGYLLLTLVQGRQKMDFRQNSGNSKILKSSSRAAGCRKRFGANEAHAFVCGRLANLGRNGVGKSTVIE